MTLLMKEDFEVKNEFITTNIYDFIEKFDGAKEYFQKQYPEWVYKEDYYLGEDEHDILHFAGTDGEAIEEFLEAQEKYYTYEFADDYENGTFTIYEIEQPPDYKEAYNILMEYFDSIADEDKQEVDERLKECGL